MTDTLARLDETLDTLWVEELGFTGTSGPISAIQFHALHDFLDRVRPVYLHHGDCVGGDEVADQICKQLGIQTVCHPPLDPKKRAFTTGHYRIHPPRDYLARNKDIVDDSLALLALPSGYYEVLRSGTWSTVRRARKKPIPRYIIWPDGRFEAE